jgi:cyclophilin family peptidyl-prolyl cis-trans isomerase
MHFGQKTFCFSVALSCLAAGMFLSSSDVIARGHTDKKEIAKASQTKGDPTVVLETTKGTIKIKVFKDEAPITSNNFLDLVNRHFYDGLSFHRYVQGFVIQGGDPRGDGTGNFTDPKTHKDRLIPLEKIQGLNHDAAGMVAMARTENPNSASCQFYITLAPQPNLDSPPGYAVFGKVIDGMPAVMQLRKGDKIKKASEQ